MTVKDLITFLQQFDGDTKVVQVDASGFPDENNEPQILVERRQERVRKDGTKYFYPEEDRIVL